MPSVHHSWFSIGLAGALLSANSGAQTIPPEVQTVAQLEKANTQTTTEIAHALTTTAPERADCVFPPDVVRGLQGARDRAAEAAASGIRGALPSPPASAARPASGPGSP